MDLESVMNNLTRPIDPAVVLQTRPAHFTLVRASFHMTSWIAEADVYSSDGNTSCAMQVLSADQQDLSKTAISQAMKREENPKESCRLPRSEFRRSQDSYPLKAIQRFKPQTYGGRPKLESFDRKFGQPANTIAEVILAIASSTSLYLFSKWQLLCHITVTYIQQRSSGGQQNYESLRSRSTEPCEIIKRQGNFHQPVPVRVLRLIYSIQICIIHPTGTLGSI